MHEVLDSIDAHDIQIGLSSNSKRTVERKKSIYNDETYSTVMHIEQKRHSDKKSKFKTPKKSLQRASLTLDEADEKLIVKSIPLTKTETKVKQQDTKRVSLS